MFLLRLHFLLYLFHLLIHLHSNMFLLRREKHITEDDIEENLHSNMFLLRLSHLYHPVRDVNIFTFQYVSIKT